MKINRKMKKCLKEINRGQTMNKLQGDAQLHITL